MFKIDLSANKLARLQERSFSEFGIRERENLQEWLIGSPDAFGEELLILQKEFDGFDETRERLDMLALDKDGQLVLIENKLDDSGRDLVWQALKYAAYCSSLDTSQIIEIFRSYLDRHHNGSGSDAVTIISEFLDGADLEETVLNNGNSQRVMLVAARFRKEVTATVLWLQSFGLSIQCFKVTPYSMGEEFILDIRQIIPTPEAEEFMIGLAGKEKSDTKAAGAVRHSHRIRLEFWTEVLNAMRAAKITRYNNISTTRDNWINCGSGISGCAYALVLSRKNVRVQLNLETSERDQNKAMFDEIHASRDKIEAEFGEPLSWLRLDDNKVSRIVSSLDCDGFNKESWPDMIDWLVDHRRRLEAALSGPLNNAARKVQAASDD